MKFFATILLFFLIVINCQAHPLHVTIANIDISGDTLKTSIRFFEDDFTNILIHEGLLKKGQNINDSLISANQIFEDFIARYFILRFGKKPVPFKFQNFEKGELTITLYFETTIPKRKKTLELSNLLMTNYFNDQKNLVIINIGGIEKGIEMDNQKTTETFYL